MAPKISDLEEYVKIWAWDTFLRTRSKDHAKLRYEDVRLDVNWARVKFISSSPEYFDQRFAERPQSQVVFSKGFTKGMHLELKLGLPDEVAGATAGFGREVTMESTDESTHEETMTWSINSTIKVPPHARTLAELVVREKEYNAKFRMNVQIKGHVIVVVTNLRDNNSFVQSIEGDFSEVIKTLSDKLDKSVTCNGRTVKWEIEGSCQFRFGVEQHVQLRESPLKEQNGAN
ncbi:hypothetical protein BaRGS_00023052 [Batillaria attramentaria]|uniref:Uncharacterized protein n=1 Tax=Batillaria attramentaria TaxID=370345 RepID=A0ABD0KFE6_9CAEN